MRNNEQYDGEYKIGISDKGRLKLDLNWKWAVSIVIVILGYVGFLLVDKYFTVPMEQLQKENIALKTELKLEKEIRENIQKENEKTFNVLDDTQKILVNKTDVTYTILMKLIPQTNINDPSISLPQPSFPGSSNNDD